MKNITSNRQVFFDFGRDYDAKLDNFFFSFENKILKSQLQQLIEDPKSEHIFLVGNSSSGKTFLLNSILNEVQSKGKPSLYIDASKLSSADNNFESLEDSFLLCLDNIDKCNHEIQVQIFNLINACKGKNTKLVLTSSTTLRDIDVFPDLQSRFAQMNSFTIKPLSESDIVEAIAFISTKLDIQLSGDAIEYLKIFVRKDFYSIKQTVVELDKFLYAERKQPSKQMVAKFLKKLKIT